MPELSLDTLVTEETPVAKDLLSSHLQGASGRGQISNGDLVNADVPSFSRRQFLKLSVAALAAMWLAACRRGATETAKPRSLKEEILAFTWEDALNEENRQGLISQLADKYLELTSSDRLTKEEMINSISFLNTRDEFIKAIQVVEPNFRPTESQWGYTHFSSRKVFIDLETLKSQSMTQIPSAESAGLALVDALWHEWGHLDVKENYQGELLNRADMKFMKPDGTTEQLRYYRGGAAYTDTYYGFLRFDEVLLETITVRRMSENLGLEKVLSAKDYYFGGVDFFVQLTQTTGISVDELYQYHANSNFEGLAKRIGKQLPGEQDELTKGVTLFIGIHQADPAFINSSGVCSLLSKGDLSYICP